jgi:ketosteroid isomerase-like protein
MNQSDNQTRGNEAEMIIGMEKSALERWGNGDPSGFLEICAPDVVYFDPTLEARIDGIEKLARYYEAIRGKVSISRFELINPLVQFAGDAAVLTFNYVSYGESEDEYRWNCTEVYRRAGTSWKIIQTHWSYTLSVRAPS